MKRSLVVGVAVLALGLVGAPPAQACTATGPPTGELEDLLAHSQTPVFGVYEQKTIARAPDLFVRGEATATVVTKYWGSPPTNTGIQVKGGEVWNPIWLYLDVVECDDDMDGRGYRILDDGPVGSVSYGVVAESEPGYENWRDAPAIVARPKARDGSRMLGPFSDRNLAYLESMFGPPTVVETSAWTRIQATLAVWAPSILILVLIPGLVVTGWMLLRRRRGRRNEEHVSTMTQQLS